MAAAMRLLLFDVDGTLIRCGTQVRPILSGVLTEVFGQAGEMDGFEFSGKTDQQIVLELLCGAGLPRERVRSGLARVRELYLERLEAGLDRGRMQLLPGVEELLGELAPRRDVALGLLTGNWEGGARIKLSRFGLERHFAFGAFGDDAVERRELLPVALERAFGATGRRFAPEETLIVGDSVRDVECGRAHGVPVLGVTTGWTPAEGLAAAGADRVVASLAGLAAELASGTAAPGLHLHARR
jgi:phosphoglycolate phosphatase-like HAD superfamily hydrolase